MIAQRRRQWRSTVEDARAFCAWAKTAEPNDEVMYHFGSLVADRAEHPGLDQLAETVLLFQETRWVVGGQIKSRLPTIEGYMYLATRTGAGRAPKSVLSGQITATQYRALEAIKERAAAVSVTRCVRDILSVSDNRAGDVVELLRSKGWVVEQPIKGWELSPSGARLLA